MTAPTDLSLFPLFASLDQVTLNDLARRMQRWHYRSGQQIAAEGELPPGAFFVAGGRVRLSRVAPDGRVQVVATLGPGEYVDLAPIFDGRPASASAHAMSAVECFVLSRSDLLALLADHPDLAFAALRSMAGQVRELLDLVEDLAFRSVRGRIARQLLAESANGPAALTQQELAERSGTVREIVGRALRRMAEEGLVRLARGRVEVIDRRGLAAAADD